VDKNHPEKRKLSRKNWRLNHPNKVRTYKKRMKAKRRNLGFIPLNEQFTNSEGHHLDKNFVVYIPESLHKSVPHNVWTGEGMNELNAKILDWLGININCIWL
jgi:hypothetical protein